MQVSVLGFGGSEIGLEGAAEAIVAQLLGKALDAGLNVIDIDECHGESENLIGKTVGQRRELDAGIHSRRHRARWGVAPSIRFRLLSTSPTAKRSN